MWCISGPTAGIVRIRKCIKFIKQLFWSISSETQALHRPEQIKTYVFLNLTTMRDIIKLHHMCMILSSMLRIHSNVCMWFRCTSRSGTSLTLSTIICVNNWYELEIIFMFNQKSMLIKICVSFRRLVVTWRIRHYP